jgi:predicted O-methyltransferase YrrM
VDIGFFEWGLTAMYALGYMVRPYLIASLGIGWGHPLMAFAQGARAAGNPNTTVNGYDEEEGRPGSIEWVRQAFIHDKIPYNLGHSSAKDYVNGIPLSHIDLFFIADDRTNKEQPRDLELAFKTLTPKGIIVTDDMLVTPEILNTFAASHGMDVQEAVSSLFVLSRK